MAATPRSTYQQSKEALEALRCDNCHGSGKIDDAAPGDISYNEFVCPTCKGLGMRPAEAGAQPDHDHNKRELYTHVKVMFHPSAEEMADCFWAMDDEEQAVFFSRLAEVSGNHLITQLSYITDRPELTVAGRMAMKLIGEYGPGVG